jgi:hypothetical protein
LERTAKLARWLRRFRRTAASGPSIWPWAAISASASGLRRRFALDRAIEIAARSGMPLKIAAKVDRVDQSYWEEKVRPMVQSRSNVEFIG